MPPMPRTFLIDGSALAYRCFFAKGPGPAFAYAGSLLALVDRGQPDYGLVVMDTPHPTFRHEKYEAYKATREKTPQELIDQLPEFERIARVLGFPVYALPGWEADDVIGTLALQAREQGHEVFLVTGDKDFMQVVREGITMWNPGNAGGDPAMLGVEAVREKFHCRPDQVIEVLALMGDASDNIPGVRNVGEKTALKLIEQYAGLDDLYAHLDQIKPAGLQERLRLGRDMAYLSRDLATIRTDAPIKLGLEDFRYRGPEREAARELFVGMDFPSLANRFLPEPSRPAESHAWHVVTTREQYEDFLRELRAATEMVVDTETTSIVPLEAELVGLSFSFRPQEAWYLPANLATPIFGPGERGQTARERAALSAPGGDMFAAGDSARVQTRGTGTPGDPLRPPPGSDLERFLADIQPVLEDPRVAVAGQNCKYDLLVLARYGVRPARVAFDTMLASYCLDAHQSQHGLDFLALKHLGFTKIPTSALIGKGKAQISMWDVPPERCGEYSCEDADITFRLMRMFAGQLESDPVLPVFRDMEMPLLRVLEDMERAGIAIDTAHLHALSVQMAGRLETLTREIHELAGGPFNIGSPKQLGEVLFEKLKVHEQLGVKRIRRTKTGWSTDAEVLDALAEHAIIARILEHRQVSKLKGTYVDSLPELVHPATGRIHTSYNQAVAVTGRLSSTDPNLQNIPVRTELGRRIRQAFVAPRGRRLLAADYSQIELRLMAHVSGDSALQAAFREGDDVHRRTAALVFGVKAEEVTPEMRAQAKTINFGIIYGMGAQRLARQTGLSLRQAEQFIEQYFRVFSGVRAWLDRTRAEATRTGVVSTLTGRRRRIEGLEGGDPRTMANALNMAVNTPLQGTAADLLKLAMIRVGAELPRRRLPATMLLTVHDELVFEVDEGAVEEVRTVVKQVMENALPLDVPLVVETGVGSNWLEAH
jgi:DNA polymerase I